MIVFELNYGRNRVFVRKLRNGRVVWKEYERARTIFANVFFPTAQSEKFGGFFLPATQHNTTHNQTLRPVTITAITELQVLYTVLVLSN